MKREIKRLGDGELDIMQVIWGTEGAVHSSYIQEQLKAKRDWPLSAVLTALNRLVAKGFLSCEKEGRSNSYRPLITREAYQEAESRSFLSRLYGNSFTGLVAALYNGKAIGREEIEDLRKFLDELEGK